MPKKAAAGRSRASAPSVRPFCSSSSVAVKSKRHDERSALLESTMMMMETPAYNAAAVNEAQTEEGWR
jgi:hypothetical protein